MCATKVESIDLDPEPIDYRFPVTTPPPAGYPARPVPDTYTSHAFDKDFHTHRQALLHHLLRNPAPANLKAPYYELARLFAGGDPHLGILNGALDYIDRRKDCADFVLHSILRWLDLRFRTGFSEWFSSFYYDEDLVALVSLVDFCHNVEIHSRAAMVLDLVLYDMALNNFRGAFASTHGRCYERGAKRSTEEDTADTQKLLFGRGQFTARNNMSAISLAPSLGYRMPRVIYQVANDALRPEMVNRQRMGIRLAEAGQVDYDSPSQARLSFGWHGPLRQNDLPVPLDSYPRYDNAYTQAPFPASEITIRQGNHWLQLNWQSTSRKASGYV